MDKQKILVVDDEAIIRQLLTRSLLKEGYEVETAEDGNIALEKAKKTSFNLLITDLKMPKKDGMEVLKEVKRTNPYVELIILTGYPTIETAVEAVRIGAFDFICKPFDVQAMLTTIKQCLEKQKYQIKHIELSELMTFAEITRLITSVFELEPLFNRILDSALSITKAKRGSLMLIDPKTRALNVKAARGLDKNIIRNTEINLNEDISDKAVQGKEQALTSSTLNIPLVSISSRSKGNALGMLNISDKVSEESFTEREKTLVFVLAGQAAVAIENAGLYLQLQENIDGLRKVIAQLNDTQNQLIQTEKLAAVGHLAFGIAHEIRNPLGIILGGVELLNNTLCKNDNASDEVVGKIKNSIDRANNIIVDLLKFSRASKLELKLVDLGKLLDEAAALVASRARLSNVEIEKNFPKENVRVNADETVLRQVFFNLYTNALDAMPKEGRLKLSISLNGKNKENNGKKENFVTVEVADTGKGIREEELSNIFNPFFTTKEPGKGTGLGLSIAHLILERHNGRIDVKSKVNEGTTFVVKLPQAA